MAQVLVIEGQSILDIAIAKCGSAEAAFEIALLNEISITEKLIPGQTLELPAVVKKDVVEYYQSKGINPATNITSDEFNSTIGGDGIGYWAIENDFIVS